MYGVEFKDWGLFEIIGIESAQEFEEDYETVDCFGIHKFPKKDYVLVKATVPFFLKPRKTLTGKYIWEHSYEGPFPKKHIFDSIMDADAYGKENSGGVVVW